MKPFRFSVFVRIIAGLTIMGGLILGASIVSLQSFNSLSQGLHSFTQSDLPNVIDGAKLDQVSANLASFAPALIAADSPGTRASIFLRVKDQVAWLDEILLQLESTGIESSILSRFRNLKDSLVLNLERIAALVQERNQIIKISDDVLRKIPDLNTQSFNLSNQLLLTNADKSLIKDIQLWHQLNTEALLLIPIAAASNHPFDLAKISDRFADIRDLIYTTSQKFPEPVQSRFRIFDLEIAKIGQLNGGIIPLRKKSLELNNQILGTLSQNNVIADRFVASSSSLTRKIRQTIQEKSDLLEKTTQERTLYFIAMTFLCLVGVVLVFLYIYKSVIRRLRSLQRNMLRHADGQDSIIVTTGNDEITDMAKAFKFFVETIKEREAALQAANIQIAEIQARLFDAIQNISEGFVLFDHNKEIVLCNDKYRQLYGYNSEDVKPGTSFDTLLNLDIEHGVMLRKTNYRQARISQFEKKQGAIEYNLADNRWISVQDCPTSDGGVVGIHVDVTNKKQAEAALVEAKEIAEHDDQAKSRFLAAASHDLRQPLHAVGLFVAELIERSHDRNVQDTVDNIERSIFHMNDLFESILDFSLLETEELMPELSNIALITVFNNIKRDFQKQARDKGLYLEFNVADDNVICDPLMLDRILRNLISNAVRYTNNGFVKVTTIHQQNEVIIEIADSGPGISKEQQALIFTDFYRGDETSIQDRGLGLGLSIASQMASLLNTKITLFSEIGQGSCFGLSLPKSIENVQDHQKNIQTISPQQSHSLKDELIIIIDDDPQILKATKNLLESWGCQTLTAQNIEDASIMIDNNLDKILAVLTDYQISSTLTGLDFLKKYPSIKDKAMIISGNTDPDILISVKEAGYSFFKKPLSPAKLAAGLRHFKRLRDTATK